MVVNIGEIWPLGSTSHRKHSVQAGLWFYPQSGAQSLRLKLAETQVASFLVQMWVLLSVVFHLCLQLCDAAFPRRFGERSVFINHVYMLLRLCLLD